MKQLQEIKKEAKTLAQKRSWVKDGFEKLLIKMDTQVEEIESDFFVQIKSNVEISDSWKNERYQGESLYFYFRFDTRKDAFFEIREELYNPEAIETESISPNSMSIPQIRDFLSELPELLEKILEKLKDENEEMKDTKEMLQKMIASVL